MTKIIPLKEDKHATEELDEAINGLKGKRFIAVSIDKDGNYDVHRAYIRDEEMALAAVMINQTLMFEQGFTVLE